MRKEEVRITKEVRLTTRINTKNMIQKIKQMKMDQNQVDLKMKRKKEKLKRKKKKKRKKKRSKEIPERTIGITGVIFRQ